MSSFGQLQEVEGRWQLRFTRHLSHPPQKVWAAITESEHLDHWFPSSILGERANGARLQFVFRNNEGPSLEGEVLTFDPPSVFEIRWAEDILRFELQPDGDGTVLTFADTIGELGKAARDGAGWHECLDLLEYHLGGGQGSSPAGQVWKEVQPTYVELWGPDAATIGPPEGQGQG